MAEDIKGKFSGILSRFGITMSPTVYQASSSPAAVIALNESAADERPEASVTVKKIRKNKT